MMKGIYLAVLAIVGLFALAACRSSGPSASSTAPTLPPDTAGSSSPAASSTPSVALPRGPGSVTIGSAAFPESELLADIYGGAMAAHGVKVKKQLNIGERGVYIAALKKGSIGAIPEYSGSILAYFDKRSTAKTPDEVFSALQTNASSQGFVVLKYAVAQDSDTITVTRRTAAKYGLTTIADMKSHAAQLTLGAPAQFQRRADGVPALKSQYGVSFGRFTALNAGGSVTVDALKNGTIDAADIFSTDPSIVQNNFVSLQDPKSMFAAQNIVPLFSRPVLTQPMADACDAVSAKLDTKTLAELMTNVAKGQQPEAVAAAWLAANGLS